MEVFLSAVRGENGNRGGTRRGNVARTEALLFFVRAHVAARPRASVLDCRHGAQKFT